jgi:hypothetical protein
VLPPLAPREGRRLTGPCRDGRRVSWARAGSARKSTETFFIALDDKLDDDIVGRERVPRGV